MAFTKASADTIRYSIDYDSLLTVGDTIATSTWTVGSPMTKSGQAHEYRSTSVYLGGGIEGQTYTATNHITTTLGETFERSLSIQVTGAIFVH